MIFCKLKNSRLGQGFPGTQSSSLPSPRGRHCNNAAAFYSNFSLSSGKAFSVHSPCYGSEDSFKDQLRCYFYQAPSKPGHQQQIGCEQCQSTFYSDRQLTGEGLPQPELLFLYLIIPYRISSPYLSSHFSNPYKNLASTTPRGNEE